MNLCFAKMDSRNIFLKSRSNRIIYYLCQMKLNELVKNIWDNQENQKLIKNFLALSVAGVVFHFLYWNTDMNTWLFGPFSTQVFDFFTLIAFNGTSVLLEAFCDIPYYTEGTKFLFFRPHPQHGVEVYAAMSIIHDCSGIKQIMQFLLIIILCTGRWWKKIPYFIAGSIVLVLANIFRIYLLTDLYAQNPEQFQFYHDWVARPMMYVVIFLLWIVWVQFFSGKKPKNDNAQDKHLRPSSDHQVAD